MPVSPSRPGESIAHVDRRTWIASDVRHRYTSTSANGSLVRPGAAAAAVSALTTFSDTARLRGCSSIAAVTSTYGARRHQPRGTITYTCVVIVWSPNWNVLIGADSGRSCSICSRVPKKSAWLGQTVAHIGFLPTLDRS